MDPSSERYGRSVASVMETVFGRHLVGTYLHGSAVLGGFDSRRSDIDVLVVCGGPTTAAQRAAVVDGLGDRFPPCPARGLELSVVDLREAQHPTARPAFELHVTTPQDAKVVDGHGRDGDPDLVLHFAVCRAAGRLLGRGRPAAEVFAPVAHALVVARLTDELSWAVEHAGGEYAVLNACRAWRFAVDGALVSKVDGGLWALDRVLVEDRGVVGSALDLQRCVRGAELDPDAVRRFVRGVLPHLAPA